MDVWEDIEEDIGDIEADNEITGEDKITLFARESGFELFDRESGFEVEGYSYDEIDCEHSSVWCLAIKERVQNHGDYEDYEVWSKRCLALVPTGVAEGQFRRVGLAFISDPQWFEDVFERIVDIV